MGRFSFRQFEICDDDATMKVGTDAVLLGAWAQVTGCKRILDVGTGCGVIALMMAQRTSENTAIDAVEINEPDFRQACTNAGTSPWKSRIKIHHTPVQDFVSPETYDLIVSNPPYFSSSLLPPEQDRAAARHDLRLTATDLLKAATRLLKDDGRLALILPTVESEPFIRLAKSFGMHLSRLTRFYTRKGKPQERSLMEFARHPQSVQEDTLLLYDHGSSWSVDYARLTKDFYLPRS
ncbi:MAG: methyltransferase [Bacteroidetes bacterium]|nr:methyltransferase [Bacteroidota bacterium]